MSKIYEALLRAELERATGSDAAVEPIKPMPPLQPAPPPVESAQSASLAVLPQSGTTLALHESTVGFRNVTEKMWSPSLLRLQALEEKGAVVEQFRTLRSRLQGFRALNTLKTVLVSSGLPQEGKSFVSVNLAITFARHRSAKVLLIDGDMRRSSLHHLLGAPNEPGLTEYLSGNATLESVMQRAKPNADGTPLPKGLASLTFIPAGADANNAADLSVSPKFAELIQAASPFFDWILIDSSPVTLVSDSTNLARAADGVLLVARSGVTKFEIAQKAMAEFKSSKMLGFVLNAVPDAPQSYGYYGYDSIEAKNETKA